MGHCDSLRWSHCSTFHRKCFPSVILLDEPELGLHPAAIGLVAGMIEQLSHDKQIIVATQSPLLVDEFELDEIIVLDLKDGQTKLRTLSTSTITRFGWTRSTRRANCGKRTFLVAGLDQAGDFRRRSD